MALIAERQRGHPPKYVDACTETNHYDPIISQRSQMPKPNYAFAKRQRDIAKKQKKEEKRQRKTGGSDNPTQESPPQPPGDEKTVA
jgi:hypothetical protein